MSIQKGRPVYVDVSLSSWTSCPTGGARWKVVYHQNKGASSSGEHEYVQHFI